MCHSHTAVSAALANSCVQSRTRAGGSYPASHAKTNSFAPQHALRPPVTPDVHSIGIDVAQTPAAVDAQTAVAKLFEDRTHGADVCRAPCQYVFQVVRVPARSTEFAFLARSHARASGDHRDHLRTRTILVHPPQLFALLHGSVIGSSRSGSCSGIGGRTDLGRRSEVSKADSADLFTSTKNSGVIATSPRDLSAAMAESLADISSVEFGK